MGAAIALKRVDNYVLWTLIVFCFTIVQSWVMNFYENTFQLYNLLKAIRHKKDYRNSLLQ